MLRVGDARNGRVILTGPGMKRSAEPITAQRKMNRKLKKKQRLLQQQQEEEEGVDGNGSSSSDDDDDGPITTPVTPIWQIREQRIRAAAALTEDDARQLRHAMGALEAPYDGGIGLAINNARFLKSASSLFKQQRAKSTWYDDCTGFDDKLRLLRMRPLQLHDIHIHFEALLVPTFSPHFTRLIPFSTADLSVYSTSRLDDVIGCLSDTMRDTKAPKHLQYAAARAMDKTIPYLAIRQYNDRQSKLPPTERGPSLAVPANNHCSVICEANLPSFHRAYFEVVYGRDCDTTTPWHHTASKTPTRAGVSRIFSDMYYRYMVAYPGFMEQAVFITICGFLGNYETTKDRAGPWLRQITQAIFNPTIVPLDPILCPPDQWPSTRQRFFALLFSQPLDRLSVHTTREYWFHLVATSPALSIHYRKIIPNYDDVQAATFDTMAQVRAYLESNLLHASGTITYEEILAAKPLIKRKGGARKWQKELAYITDSGYEKCKGFSFRRTVAPPLSELRTVHGKIPATLAWVAKTGSSVYMDGPPSADEKCSMTRRAKRLRQAQSNPSATLANRAKAERYVADLAADFDSRVDSGEAGPLFSRIFDGVTGSASEDCIPVTRDRIIGHHDRYLRMTIPHIPDYLSSQDVFEIVCELIKDCGASRLIIERLVQVTSPITHSGTNDRLTVLLGAIRTLGPYTYNLAQVAAGIRESGCGLSVYALPIEIQINQRRALATRYHLPPDTDVMPLIPTHFFWCGVCGVVYSVGYGTIRSKKHRFSHGLQEVEMDSSTGEVYCNDNTTVGSVSCQDQPLSRVRIDGYVLRLNGASYTICAQPMCGMLFKIEPATATSTSYGPQCLRCFAESRRHHYSIPRFVSSVLQTRYRETPDSEELIPPPLLCFLCDRRPLRLNRDITIMGKNTFICHRPFHGVLRWKHLLYETLKREGHSTLIEEEGEDAEPTETEMRVRVLAVSHEKAHRASELQRKLARSKRDARQWKRADALRKHR